MRNFEETFVVTKYRNKLITYRFSQNVLMDIRVHSESIVGHIFVGRVENVLHNINAAFVEFAKGKIGYLPLGDYLSEKTPYLQLLNRTLNGKLASGDSLLVQVEKDRIKTKDPVLTTKLSFAGKYVLLTTENTRIGISAKLLMAEKQQIKDLLLPCIQNLENRDSFGFVIRTSIRDLMQGIEEKNTEERQDVIDIFYREVVTLLNTAVKTLQEASTRTVCSCIYENELDYLQFLRDHYIPEKHKIITDDIEIHEKIKTYFETIGNDQATPMEIALYEDKAFPLTKLYSLETRTEEVLGKKIWLKSGGYLVIEPTEALTVIDVNTGKYSGKKKLQDTFLHINKEACYEIARQIRLRNLSGIILIDFINMEPEAHKKELIETLQELLRKDPLKTVLVDITRLGLVEITRRKVYASLKEQLENE